MEKASNLKDGEEELNKGAYTDDTKVFRVPKMSAD